MSQGAAGIPVNPAWTRERPYLTRDFILISKAEEPVSWNIVYLTLSVSKLEYYLSHIVSCKQTIELGFTSSKQRYLNLLAKALVLAWL